MSSEEEQRQQTTYAFALWNLVIRPPRASYDPANLGPEEFIVFGVRVKRHDLQLRGPRGQHLACTHFVPVAPPGRSKDQMPVVIYLHGNSSSRMEACGVAKALLSRRIALFCYDAAGCGRSDGEYVSLGWHEREDLAMVIEHLRGSPACGAIGLWGRSMGAVTALLHADRDHSIGAMCLDSPFASLRELICELAQSEHIAIRVPIWLLSLVLQFVRLRIKALADFDIEDLVPAEHVQDSFAPALFLHGKSDTFILPSQSKQLYEAYAGDKEYLEFNGDHNSERGQDIVEHVVNFFCRAFRHDIFAPYDQTVPSLASRLRSCDSTKLGPAPFAPRAPKSQRADSSPPPMDAAGNFGSSPLPTQRAPLAEPRRLEKAMHVTVADLPQGQIGYPRKPFSELAQTSNVPRAVGKVSTDEVLRQTAMKLEELLEPEEARRRGPSRGGKENVPPPRTRPTSRNVGGPKMENIGQIFSDDVVAEKRLMDAALEAYVSEEVPMGSTRL